MASGEPAYDLDGAVGAGARPEAATSAGRTPTGTAPTGALPAGPPSAGAPSTRTPPTRAGLGTSLGFFLVPPAAGVALGGILLTHPENILQVLLWSLGVAVVSFLLVGPLGRRSDDFRNPLYRRGTELAVLAGLSACALIAYTLIVYLLLGFRTPWLLNAAVAVAGG